MPRDITSQFNAIDIRGESRSIVNTQIEDAMRENITAKHILIERTELRSITLPGDFEQALVDKKVA